MAKLLSPELGSAPPKALLAPPAAEAAPPPKPPPMLPILPMLPKPPLPKPPALFVALPPNELPKTLGEAVDPCRPAKGDAAPLPPKLNVGGEANAGAGDAEAGFGDEEGALAPPRAPNGEAEPEAEPNREGLADAPAPPRLPNGEAELVSLAKPDEAKEDVGATEAAAGFSSLVGAPDEELSVVFV